ncbi:MAG: hypothetical protein H8E48_10390 [Chloroflexi bacterium]|nr:hypothetical protein [Chloroflexota bacterium]
MVNATAEINNQVSTDWKDILTKVSTDPNASQVLKNALAEALQQDPELAMKEAETFYQIMLQRASAQPSVEWKWRRQPTWCWVCNSHNTRLVGATGYGIVHECLNCGDQFLLESAIQWSS